MTREDAIRYLKSDLRVTYRNEMRQAITMGIEALEQPQIVRCKDCKHMTSLLCADGSSVIGCERWGMRGDDWYCANGEPKDGDGDG